MAATLPEPDSERARDSGDGFSDRSGVTINARVGVMGRESDRAVEEEEEEDGGVVLSAGVAYVAVAINDDVVSDDGRPWVSS